jgi:hypothetical protein
MSVLCFQQKERVSMLKVGKLALALVLGLVMSLSLLASGVFAQSVKGDNPGAPVQTVAGTHVASPAGQVVRGTTLQVTGTQQANRVVDWGPGWRGGWWGGRRFFHHHFFFRHRFFHRRFFFGDFDGCGCGC